MSDKSRSPEREFRLAGIGKCTKGLKHTLQPGDSVTIGRSPDCTLAVLRTPESAGDVVYLSRIHAVIEQDPQGRWLLRDNDSTNGTVILRGGFPPAKPVRGSAEEPLEDGDVVELAGDPSFDFVYQAVAAAAKAIDRELENHTQRLIEAERRCLQRIQNGVARQVVEVTGGRVVIGGDRPAAAPNEAWLELPELHSEAAVAEVTSQAGRVVFRCFSPELLLNLKPVDEAEEAELKDGDLISLKNSPETFILYFDPGGVKPRHLSDLLLDADRVTIGTGESNAVRLLHPSLSRYHAEIWRSGGELFIRDLGSTNGTAVDGQRIFDDRKLQPEVRFTLGRLPFVADAACWGTPQSAPGGVDVRLAGVSVKVAGKLRLHGVSMAVGHGEMVGLLGPSASGKSTLLKALAGQYPATQGEMIVNGRTMHRNASGWSWFASLMGYRDEDYQVGFVQQHDLVQPGLTVREILEYAARQMALSPAEAQRAAQEAGDRCNLGPLLDRVAQDANGRLNMSGGQLKRVCVALEILRRPRILVLDEPTTGQDPTNADALMQLFRSLAQDGVTVLLSTHDLRNAEHFFDKVAVLSVGYLVYYGPPRLFPQHFNADSMEAVYASLPDRESMAEQARNLAREFEGTTLYRQYCRWESAGA